jgi:hypothetical protein
MIKLFAKLWALTGSAVGGYVFYENQRHIGPMLPPHLTHSESVELKNFITKIIIGKSLWYGLFYPVTVSKLIDNKTNNILLPMYTTHFKYTIGKRTFEKLPHRQQFEQSTPFNDKYKFYIHGTFNKEKNEIIKYHYDKFLKEN